MPRFRRFVPYLVFMLIILIMASMNSAYGENLLENHDFSMLDEDGLPAEWYTDAYITDTGYSVFGVTEGNEDHPFAISIQNIDENDARFAQVVPVDPDSIYCLSGYILASGVEGGHGANLSVEGVYAFSEQVYDTEGEWIYIEYYGETGPDQAYVTVFARLGGYSGVSTGKAFFADLSLTKVDSIPGDSVADLWYRIPADVEDEDEEDTSEGIPFVFWLLFISFAYLCASLLTLYFEHQHSMSPLQKNSIRPVYAAGILLAGLLLRIIISYLVEGYMVDVNCFLSWGHTMAAFGPGRFYSETSFCDYPPLYTYVLGLNSLITDWLGGSTETARIVFRFVPSLCDLSGCWMIYRLLTQQNLLRERSCLLFLAAAVLNPASVLNSAAWGQMDSVLCLLLLSVSLLAVKGKWKTALPLYVVAVLVKPQALMLGPLGLAYILLYYIRQPEKNTRRQILSGTAIGFLVLFAGVLPFSLHQASDWLISLYGSTLASYPYATVNTANLYYLLGGNWSAVGNTAHYLAPVVLSVLSAGYGILWMIRAKKHPLCLIETGICFVFTAAFVLCACLEASWAWTGGVALALPFVIVLSSAVRNRDIQLLPWLGGLLYILLYVFGVKMHERYVFPALLLLAASWTLLKDRRILYILLLFTVTVFVNEGIILNNSIELGSSLGHLNSDTVWLADILSLLNISGAIYAVWLNTEYTCGIREHTVEKKMPAERSALNADRFLHWKRKDTVLLTCITLVYTVISLSTLGSTKAPQTCWTSSSRNEQVVFDLGESRHSFEILYFAQVSYNDFTFEVSEDGEHWGTETWAEMREGQCWKWKYVLNSYSDDSEERKYTSTYESNIIRFSGRYVRLTSCQVGLKLNEILFRDTEGHVLPASILERTGAEPDSELYSDPAALLDEQDTMERLPALPETDETVQAKIQPSWWNSTYFDEIYHARTGFEFLDGSRPYETSHPQLGKVLISISISIFGMTPFGWRFAGALAGIMMLPGIYLLAKQLTKKTAPAVMACMLMALDCQHLTQTQIATIDSFPVLFIIFAYFFMLRFMQTDFISEKKRTTLLSLGLSGFFMGLSIASKWIGIYAGAGLAVLFFIHCFRTIRCKTASGGMSMRTAIGKTLSICLWCFLFFIIIPFIIYLLSYIPYMSYYAKRIHSLRDYIAEVFNAQVNMYNYHSSHNLGSDHPFYSPWWQWPVNGKPMYYAAQMFIHSDNPVYHSIFCFGNPIIWYGGLAALVVCSLRASVNRRYRLEGTDYLWHLKSSTGDPRFAFVLIGILAQYLPWVLVPRGTYIYHYFASTPFLMLATALSFDGYDKKWNRLLHVLYAVFLVAALVFFILLFPYASGISVSPDWMNIGNKLLRIYYSLDL